MANDGQIAKQIIAQLKQQKQAANLKGFDLGVQVDNGTVTMMGQVASPEQAMLALDTARRVSGVKLVVNDLLVAARQAQPAPIAPARTQQQPVQPIAQQAIQTVAAQQMLPQQMLPQQALPQQALPQQPAVAHLPSDGCHWLGGCPSGSATASCFCAVDDPSGFGSFARYAR